MFQKKAIPFVVLFALLFTVSPASAQVPPPPPPTRDDEATQRAMWDTDPRYPNWRKRREQEALRKKAAEERQRALIRKQQKKKAAAAKPGTGTASPRFATSSRTLNVKGCAYYRKRDWANAVKCFKEAARLNPKDAVIKKNLQNARAQLQRQVDERNRRWVEARKNAEAKRKIDALLDEAAKPKQRDSRSPATGDSGGLSFDSLDEPAVPAKPEAAQPSRVSQLSDKQLDAEIARLRKIFVKIKDDYQADVKDLRHWVRESQEAQRAAIKASTDQLLGILKSEGLKKLTGNPAFKKKVSKLNKAAIELGKELAKTGDDYARSSRDRQAKLQAAHATLTSAYDFLSECDAKTSKAGGSIVGLASYLIDYAEQATRWNLARGQIRMINDNLEGPGGKLAAVKALKKFHKALIQERNKRRRPVRR